MNLHGDIASAMTSADTPDSTALVDEWRARVSRLLIERRVHRKVESPRLTLAVIAYRSNPVALRECLESIQRTVARAGVAVERLVADCGGLEPCQDTVRALSDTELVLQPDCSLNEARNAILAWAEGDVLMLADDDGVLEPDAVPGVLRHLASDELVALRGRIRAKKNRYFTALAGHYDRGDRVVDDLLLVEGHMAVRREAALRTGGFEEKMFGGEGTVFSYRLLRQNPGKRIVYAPDVVMRHDFYHDVRHFLKKSRGFADLNGMLMDSYGHEPGFAEFLDAKKRRKYARTPLRADEWVASRGLELARTAIQLWTRMRARSRDRKSP